MDRSFCEIYLGKILAWSPFPLLLLRATVLVLCTFHVFIYIGDEYRDLQFYIYFFWSREISDGRLLEK